MKKIVCNRCTKPAFSRTMSMFDTSMICIDCKAKEKQHPDYTKARDAELEAVRNGDLNFPGIGLPADLKKK